MANQSPPSKGSNHDELHTYGFCYDEGRKSVHPSSTFSGTVWGDPFFPAEYQNKCIGFVEDRISGANPNAFVIKDAL